MSNYRPQITRVTPSSGSAASKLKAGRELLNQEKFEEAWAEFDAAARAEPGDRKAHLFCAATLVRLKRFDEAIAHCEEVHRIDPMNMQAYLRHARALLGKKEWAAAREKVETALRIDPQSASGHFFLGYLAFSAGEYDQAREAYGKALLLNPRMVRARIEHARVSMLQNRLDEALRQATAGVRIDPRSGIVQEALGRVCLARGEHAAALEAYEQAIACGRQSSDEAHIGLAEAAIGLERYDVADKHLRQVEASARGQIRLQRVWGDLEYARGEFSLAVEQYRAALMLAAKEGAKISPASEALPETEDPAVWKTLADQLRADLETVRQREITHEIPNEPGDE